MRLLSAVLVICVGSAMAVACSIDETDGGDRSTDSHQPTDCDGTLEAPEPRFVVDACGRVVLLRGANMENSSKGSSQDDPHLPASGWQSQQHLGQLGWNSVRFLIFWGAVEPERGVYDEDYLDEVEEWLDGYADQGIHVVLDMHQDLYGWFSGGDGAPDWAVVTDGLEVQPLAAGEPWYLRNFDPAVQRAIQNFWDVSRGHGDLREHFFDAWQHVAERFADHPAVIGYDVFNEPMFANDVDRANLTEFSQGVVEAIRRSDDDAWIMLEPTILTGFGENPTPGDLIPEGLDDPRDGPPRLGYAPHLYEMSVHDGRGYSQTSTYVDEFEDLRSTEAAAMDATLYIGEFGGGPDNDRMDEYLEDVTAMADRQMIGWALWSWDPPESPEGSWAPVTREGDLTENGRRLARVQPRAVAGTPESFSWDPTTRVFHMAWSERDGVEGPTELGVPVGLWDGEVEVVLDGEVVDAEIDEENGTLSLRPDPQPRHEVCVRWGGHAGAC